MFWFEKEKQSKHTIQGESRLLRSNSLCHHAMLLPTRVEGALCENGRTAVKQSKVKGYCNKNVVLFS